MPVLAQAIERRHQIGEAVVFEGVVVHAVVADFLRIIGKPWHSEKCDAVIGCVVGGPCRDVVAEIHLGADDLPVPRDHLVETTGLDGDVMKLRLNHHFFLALSGSSSRNGYPHKSAIASASLSGIDRNGEWLAGKLRTSTGGDLEIMSRCISIESARSSVHST